MTILLSDSYQSINPSPWQLKPLSSFSNQIPLKRTSPAPSSSASSRKTSPFVASK
ncbi:hypothetical protein [Rubritalea tangerina]|uniref:hypothetical protein n=1 Tax=Rubritalea tangerina TaxID=430798 RepID=UPI0036155D71